MSKSKDVAKNYQQVSLFQREEGKKLIDDVQIHRGHVILDLGCGTGELSAYLSELVRQDGRVVAELFLHWYISLRLHGLYNTFFSAFYSKQ